MFAVYIMADMCISLFANENEDCLNIYIFGSTFCERKKSMLRGEYIATLFYLYYIRYFMVILKNKSWIQWLHL